MRWHLALLAAALALPILAFAGLLLWRTAEAERARLEAEALSVAGAAANAVEREITGLAYALDVLALSARLRSGDLPGFHAQITEIRDRFGLNTVLRDTTGQQLVSARVPWGQPLPVGNIPEPDPARWREERAVVSDLFTGAVARAPPRAAGAVHHGLHAQRHHPPRAAGRGGGTPRQAVLGRRAGGAGGADARRSVIAPARSRAGEWG